MKTTQIKMDTSRHVRMKELAEKNNRNIIDEYREAIDNHIMRMAQEEILDNSKIETIINERVKKAEDRIAGMLGRTGMDTSIVVMGLIDFLAKFFKIDRKELYDDLRKRAAQYYTRPYKK